MKWSDLKQMSETALNTEAEKLVEELRNLRFQSSIGPLENGLLVRNTRRRLARIQTLMSQLRTRPAGIVTS